MSSKRLRACSPFDEVIARNVAFPDADELSSTQSVVQPRSEASSAAASIVANDETMRTELTDVLTMDDLHRTVRSAIQKGLEEACAEALQNPLRVSTICQKQSWSIAAAVMRELEPFVNGHEQATQNADATQNSSRTGGDDQAAARDVENEDEADATTGNVTGDEVDGHDSEDSDSGSTDSSDSEKDGPRWKLEDLCQILKRKMRRCDKYPLKCVLCGKGPTEARHMVTFHLKNGKRETPYPCSSAQCPFGFFRQTDAKKHSERAGKGHGVHRRYNSDEGRYYHYSTDSSKYRRLFNIV